MYKDGVSSTKVAINTSHDTEPKSINTTPLYKEKNSLVLQPVTRVTDVLNIGYPGTDNRDGSTILSPIPISPVKYSSRIVPIIYPWVSEEELRSV